jgi:hypothetical protein
MRLNCCSPNVRRRRHWPLLGTTESPRYHRYTSFPRVRGRIYATAPTDDGGSLHVFEDEEDRDRMVSSIPPPTKSSGGARKSWDCGSAWTPRGLTTRGVGLAVATALAAKTGQALMPASGRSTRVISIHRVSFALWREALLFAKAVLRGSADTRTTGAIPSSRAIRAHASPRAAIFNAYSRGGPRQRRRLAVTLSTVRKNRPLPTGAAVAPISGRPAASQSPTSGGT